MEPAKKMNDQEIQKAGDELLGEGEGSLEVARTRRRRSRATGSDVSVNMNELRELVQLIRENEFTEFELEREGFHVRFRRGGEPVPAGEGAYQAPASETSSQSLTATSSGAETRVSTTGAAAHLGSKSQTAASEDQDLHIIPSPIVGTFYRAASPNADPFVKIGTTVKPDSVVCIIEAMKLMNEIQAETNGEVVKIYVENGQPVEYGQALFGIKQ
jgi:acetyl-CoA carboxylase biotin carboxyl carrier protein